MKRKGRDRERDHHNDEIFMRLGAYALDVSDPEDEGEVEFVGCRARGERGLKEGAEVEVEGSMAGELELRKVEEAENRDARGVQSKSPKPAQTPKATPQRDKPRFNPATLSRDNSKTMLLGKYAVEPPPSPPSPPLRTQSTNTSLVMPDPTSELLRSPPPTKSPPSSKPFQIQISRT